MMLRRRTLVILSVAGWTAFAIATGYGYLATAQLTQDESDRAIALDLATSAAADTRQAAKDLDDLSRNAMAAAMALSDCTGRLRKATGKETL
jgi:hypothetical protein